MSSRAATRGSGGEDRTTENVTLNFKKFKQKYNQQSKSGGLEASDDFAFDIAKNAQA